MLKILETHKLKREGLFKMQSMAYSDKKHILCMCMKKK